MRSGWSSDVGREAVNLRQHCGFSGRHSDRGLGSSQGHSLVCWKPGSAEVAVAQRFPCSAHQGAFSDQCNPSWVSICQPWWHLETGALVVGPLTPQGLVGSLLHEGQCSRVRSLRTVCIFLWLLCVSFTLTK